MGLCVAITENGTLIPTGQPVTECAGYVLLSSAEASHVTLIAQAFEAPNKEDLATWVAMPFTLIVTLYVAARLAGNVAAFFSKN